MKRARERLIEYRELSNFKNNAARSFFSFLFFYQIAFVLKSTVGKSVSGVDFLQKRVSASYRK